jgi:putative restriction endonuclease
LGIDIHNIEERQFLVETIMDERLEENLRSLTYYCKCFTNLNVSNNISRGKALHKPILILSVLELIAQEEITENKILISDQLIDTFNKYWNIFVKSDAGFVRGIHYPFFYLRTEGFWYLQSEDSLDGVKIKTIGKLREKIKYAYLDNELFNLLQDPFSRQVLIDSLVTNWFADSQAELSDLSEIDQNLDRVEQSELENFDSEIKFTWRKSVIRNSFFRKSVVFAYDYRCAFCKLKITRNPNQNIVDGAHIKPFADFSDSKIDNGLSLCKNHHWAFDLGWFSIDDNYQILVAHDLEDDSPYTRSMKDFDRESIALPSNEKYFPRLEALKWHREHKFKA